MGRIQIFMDFRCGLKYGVECKCSCCGNNMCVCVCAIVYVCKCVCVFGFGCVHKSGKARDHKGECSDIFQSVAVGGKV